MKQKITPLQGVALWLGTVTLPHIVRKIVSSERFTGHISMLNISSNKDIGYYVFPGILGPDDSVFRDFFKPLRYDFSVVHYGRQDYDPDSAAEAVAKHARSQGYKKIRIISIATGDQLFRNLGLCLKDYLDSDNLEIVTIDSLPHPEFIHERYRRPLQNLEPLLVALRTLGGWLLELPLIRHAGRWHSPAVILEQLTSITSWAYDYSEDGIINSVVAAIQDSEAFFAPDNSEQLYDLTFNWPEEDELDSTECRVYHNYFGAPADFQDDCTKTSYKKVFEALSWQF